MAARELRAFLRRAGWMLLGRDGPCEQWRKAGVLVNLRVDRGSFSVAPEVVRLVRTVEGGR
jgi:hypothetical protein